MSSSERLPEVERKWFRLGVVLAFLQATFVLVILVLFQIDPTLALTVAVVVGVLGGIGITVFVLYVY
ncbi:hypothetical protein ACYJ1Y_13285 [Natrialbaceae archaeon A-gly3]